MKIPDRPPDWMKLLADADGTDIAKMLGATAGPCVNGRYVHWDKLKRLKPAEGLNHQLWWTALKIRRRSLLKDLPLQDTNDRTFRFAVPDQAYEILHTLDRDAAGQIVVGEEVITTEARDRYVVRSLMEEAITSSQLEGAATTRRVAKEMLRSGRKPRDRSEQMIANNYHAMQRTVALKDQPLSVDIIIELQRILTNDTVDDESWVGRIRQADEPIAVMDSYNEVLHTPPDADTLPDRMKRMCDFANQVTPSGFVHPVIRAIVLHFWLAYDHPFCDGNGRCARALFYWSMLHQGYWLAEFLSISPFLTKAPARYGRAFLYSETDENDLTYFILFHLELIRRAIDEIQSYVKSRIDEVRSAEALLRKSVSLNHRQLALISRALRHPDSAFTVKSHQRSHNIVYETARQDLRELEERGLLRMRRIGKEFNYFSTPGLEHKIRQLR
jgi:Fic family protein